MHISSFPGKQFKTNPTADGTIIQKNEGFMSFKQMTTYTSLGLELIMRKYLFTPYTLHYP